MNGHEAQIILVGQVSDDLYLVGLRILNQNHVFAAVPEPTHQKEFIKCRDLRFLDGRLGQGEGVAFPKLGVPFRLEAGWNVLPKCMGRD
jgi:hypothetical protein